MIDLVWTKRTTFHTVVTTRGGYYDLRTSAGRKALRDAVNAAAGESDNISDRVKVRKATLARRGMPNGGRRPYGFEPDQIAHRGSEIAVIREVADRIIKGESARRVFADLNERGVPTAEGGRWTKGTMTNMLRRKRYGEYGSSGKGIRVHKGVEYKAVWSAVFDRVTFEKLQAALRANEQMAATRGEPRKNLLTGFVYCGACGRRLNGIVKQDHPGQPKKARYTCRPYDAYGRATGCARVSVMAEPLEDLVTEVVLWRLDSDEFADVFAESKDDSTKLRTALDDHQAKKTRLDELIDSYYGDNPDSLTREQFMRAKSAGEASLHAAEREVEKYSAKRVAVGIPIGQTIREAWNNNQDDLGWRRQVLQLAGVHKIVIHPSRLKPRYECHNGKVFKFHRERVEFEFTA